VGWQFWRAPAFFNYTALPSSATVTLEVQEDPVDLYPATNPGDPTDYWKRPIYGENREYSQYANNWLHSAYNPGRRAFDSGSVYAPKVNGPETPHIMWTRPYYQGGQVGYELEGISYYHGLSYEMGFQPPVIIEGRMYYNVYRPSGFVGTTDPTVLRGTVCVDLQTGEEIWFKEDMLLAFGQVFNYDSPNQHGAHAYLWTTSGSTYTMYDALYGNPVLNITDVPGGTQAIGPNGEVLKYRVSGGRLLVWNSTVAIGQASYFSTEGEWHWRPYAFAPTVNGSLPNAYSLNVSLSGGSSVQAIYEDNIYLTQGGTWYCYNRWTGAQVWQAALTETSDYPEGYLNSRTVFDPSTEIFARFIGETMQWWGYDVSTGNKIWGPTEPYENPRGQYQVYTGPIAGGGYIYAGTYDGILRCFDITTGEEVWQYYAGDAGLETPYGTWPFYGGIVIADGKVYAPNAEHSPGTPLWRGEQLHVVDAETGDSVFAISGWWTHPNLADGYLVSLNAYDNQIYCLGKGPSTTTISAPQAGVVVGEGITLTGTVTDQSPGNPGIACVSDDSMSAWMEYLYMQQAYPTDAVGVEITVDIIDPNGNFFNIGTATTDLEGNFGLGWTPEIPGMFQILVHFAGSEAYGSSYATTYLNVNEAPVLPPPEPTPEPTPIPMTDTYLAGSTIAILAGIAVAAFLILRKK
jgi:outer membrane protein assembly factor BamB